MKDTGKRKPEHVGKDAGAPKRRRDADGGGGGGGGHDVVSAGGFEDRRKYRVDAETVKYYTEIAALVAPPTAAASAAAAASGEAAEGMDAEQRSMLVSNALTEAAGRELHLALDPTCSHVVQSLLAHAPAAALVAYLAPFGTGGLAVTLVTNPFGSHVSESLFGALRAALAPEAATERETVAAARAALEALCEQLGSRALQLVAHRAASPALRALLGLLSGRDLGRQHGEKVSGDKGGGDKQRPSEAPAAGSGGGAGAAVAPPPQGRRFTKLLARFVDACLTALMESGEYWEYAADPACSAFLQAVACAYAGDDDALRRVLPRLLGGPRLDDDTPTPADGACLALVAPSDMGAALRDASGSRLVEALLRVAPCGVRHELHTRFLAGSLRELATHGCANFAVQAYLRSLAAGDEAQLRAALDELAPELGRLLSANRGGVVCALLAACTAVGALHKEAAQALSRGVVALNRDAAPAAAAAPAPAAGERDNSAYVSILAPALLRRAAGSVSKGGFSVHGCAALATVLAFPPAACRQYADTMAALPAAEAAAAACDSAASRVMEAMLRGGAPPGLKRKLLLTLSPRWAALAVSPAGSHVVDAAYDAAEPKEREALVAALAAGERTLAASRYGTSLLRRMGVAEFKRDPAAWRRRHAAAAQVRAAFADLLADEPQVAVPAGGKASKPKAAKLAGEGGAKHSDPRLSATLQRAMRDLR
jgi:hypothetical protein